MSNYFIYDNLKVKDQIQKKIPKIIQDTSYSEILITTLRAFWGSSWKDLLPQVWQDLQLCW